MADITLLTLDDPVDGSLTIINGNFTAINTELGSHTHAASAITSGVFSAARLASGTPTTSSFLRGDSVWAAVTWSDVTGKPTTFPPSAHNHSASEITAGVLAPARLGSGTASSSKFLRGDQQWASISLDNLAETGGYFYRAGRALVWENPPDTYGRDQSAQLVLLGHSGSDVPVIGGLLETYSSRGTPASPIPLKQHDNLAQWVFYGRRPDGSWAEGGRIFIGIPQDWSNTSTPADITISLNAPGESHYFNQKFYFNGAGRLGIKTNPVYELDVNGTARATTLMGNLDWSYVTNKPSSFTPSAHTHAPSELTSGGASAGQALVWDGFAWAPQTLAAPGAYQTKTANFTAAGGGAYFLGANNVAVTLPASPADGTRVYLIWVGSGCTVVPSGTQKIMGANEVFYFDVYPYAVQLVYISSENDWRIAA
jgi:hypothetical protein